VVLHIYGSTIPLNTAIPSSGIACSCLLAASKSSCSTGWNRSPQWSSPASWAFRSSLSKTHKLRMNASCPLKLPPICLSARLPLRHTSLRCLLPKPQLRSRPVLPSAMVLPSSHGARWSKALRLRFEWLPLQLLQPLLHLNQLLPPPRRLLRQSRL